MIVTTEVQEMEQTLPKTCRVHFDDPNKLYQFALTITPDDGYWHGGKFKFLLQVPEEYNLVVSWSKSLFTDCFMQHNNLNCSESTK